MINQGKKVLCTICARGGSKGVKNKNIRLLCGKPLIAHTIEQAKKSELFENIVVSTDSDCIAHEAVKCGAEVFFKRSSELASDHSGKIEVIRDAFIRSEEYYNRQFDILIDLDATSPLRSVDDIILSYAQFVNKNNSNLITAMPSRRNPYFNMIEVDSNGGVGLSKCDGSSIVCRQDAPKCYDMNASIYIWKREVILSEDRLFHDNTGLYVMPEERSIDIDSELDFKFVEFIMKSK